jgi:hypothetical protein
MEFGGTIWGPIMLLVVNDGRSKRNAQTVWLSPSLAAAIEFPTTVEESGTEHGALPILPEIRGRAAATSPSIG